MKKTIAILLSLCLCIGLCACGKAKNVEPAEPTSIELTSKNISQYLNIKIGKPVDMGEAHRKTTTIEVYPLQAGDYNNVKLNLYIKDCDGDIDSVAGSDSWEYEDKQVIPISLPVDGRYSVEVTIRNIWSNFWYVEEVEIQNVSGTFTPR